MNEPLLKLLSSNVSMRRSAKILNIHRITVARKLVFLSQQARLFQRHFLESLKNSPLEHVQFDDVETIEHTKMKPLSISLVVTPQRKILAATVSQMPAKGPLAAKALKKYGRREDRRRHALMTTFLGLKEVIHEKALFESDQNPLYPRVLSKTFPSAVHRTVKARRGCVTGQGELKKIDWDPIFALNHTAAMLRANICRLIRKTWCTTKRPDRLQNHLDIYIDFHNRRLTA